MAALYSVWHPGDLPEHQVGFALPEHTIRGTDTQLDNDLDSLSRIGCSWLRTDAYWNACEQNQGTYVWTNLDRIVAGCSARGIRVVLVAHTMPPWARPTPTDPDVTGPVTTAQRDWYVRFVTALAARYAAGGTVRALEIWNEPNLDQFWAPTPSAVDYRALLTAAYAAVKGVDPTMLVLGCCTGGASGTPDIPAVQFVTDVCAAGGVWAMDGVSHHPYALHGGISGSLTETPAIQDAVSAAGRPHLPVWGTESGCSTGGTDTPVVSEDVQAQSAVQMWRYWRSIRARGPLFWYTLHDPPDTDTATSRYGPIRANGTDKPVVSVMQALAGARTAPGVIEAEWGVVR